MPSASRRLHRHPLSGHSHRVQLLLSLLGLDAELIDVDLKSGANRAEGFLALNPLGQLPVLEDAGEVLADSNAILVYLALKYDPSGQWFPREPLRAARVQRWLSVAAGELAAGPAAARLINVFGLPMDKQRALTISGRLLPFMEKELSSRPFLIGEEPTIADVAMYTYTAHAPEGDVPLDIYPSVRSWIAQVEGLSGFVAMQRAVQAGIAQAS